MTVAPHHHPSRARRQPHPAYPEELARFYEQDLDWRDCGANQCSRLEVPLDYADPDGKVIELAVLRVPAKQRGKRVGQLVVNPGGPGGSGVDYAASGSFSFGEKLTRYFDIVGFDPRGVGEEHPARVRRHGADRRVPQLPTRTPTPPTRWPASIGSPASSARAACPRAAT